MKWTPPRSPHNLIQEELWPDEWKILVSCLMLNLTTRKQLDKIRVGFFDKYPDAAAMAMADEGRLREMIKSLGLANKRAKTLIRFSREYLKEGWTTAKDLHGCGKYADDTWRIFCKGEWESVAPNDHALNKYCNWLGGKTDA